MDPLHVLHAGRRRSCAGGASVSACSVNRSITRIRDREAVVGRDLQVREDARPPQTSNGLAGADSRRELAVELPDGDQQRRGVAGRVETGNAEEIDEAVPLDTQRRSPSASSRPTIASTLAATRAWNCRVPSNAGTTCCSRKARTASSISRASGRSCMVSRSTGHIPPRRGADAGSMLFTPPSR